MNLNKPKNWDTIDYAEGGYTETGYEFFEYVPSIPLLKAKGKDLWHIGSIYKDTKQLRPEHLFSNENEARQAFEGVKRFIKSELDSRRRFKDKPSEFLRDWLKEYGSNPYVGDSIYLQTALEELQIAMSRDENIIKGVNMEEKLIALVKYPYEKPKTVELQKGLKPLQEIVGGMITGADLPGIEGVYGYANDEGLLIGLEPNIYRPQYKDAIVGPLVFVGAGVGGEDVSLTPEQVKQVTNYLEINSVSDFGEFLFHIETNFTHYKPKQQAEM